jgi:hypothetical protein
MPRSRFGSKAAVGGRSPDVRLSPDSGGIADIPQPPLRAMCGRLRVGKKNLHLQRWSEQPCVRPACAVPMTAGHNALRGSGPGQNLAFDDAVALVGCPDRRVDRHCIKCCSSSQPLGHAGLSGVSSFTPRERRVPHNVRSWPSSPRPSGRVCWRARWPRPWLAAAPTTR